MKLLYILAALLLSTPLFAQGTKHSTPTPIATTNQASSQVIAATYGQSAHRARIMPAFKTFSGPHYRVVNTYRYNRGRDYATSGSY